MKKNIFLLIYLSISIPFLIFSQTNGYSPYDLYFGVGIYDNNSYNQFTIKNTHESDVVVCLEDIYTGRKIRNSYILKGTSYTMKNIPNGSYVVKVFYGNNWNPNKLLLGGKIKGGFDKDFSFAVFDDKDDYVNMNQYVTQEKTNEGIMEYTNYSSPVLTLYGVIDGNAEQTEISADDFFE